MNKQIHTKTQGKWQSNNQKQVNTKRPTTDKGQEANYRWGPASKRHMKKTNTWATSRGNRQIVTNGKIQPCYIPLVPLKQYDSSSSLHHAINMRTFGICAPYGLGLMLFAKCPYWIPTWLSIPIHTLSLLVSFVLQSWGGPESGRGPGWGGEGRGGELRGHEEPVRQGEPGNHADPRGEEEQEDDCQGIGRPPSNGQDCKSNLMYNIWPDVLLFDDIIISGFGKSEPSYMNSECVVIINPFTVVLDKAIHTNKCWKL